jgi:hypothetical protein
VKLPTSASAGGPVSHQRGFELLSGHHHIARRPLWVEHGDKRVALLQEEHIAKMLSTITKLSAKRHWLKAIRGLLRCSIPSMRKDDPTAGIASIKLPRESVVILPR